MFLNTFYHCPRCVVDVTYTHAYTYNSFANVVFLIGGCDSHFPAAEILNILILTSRNFL